MSPPRRGAGDAVKDGFLFLQEVQKMMRSVGMLRD
jgi:hypothetical protein